METDDDDVDEVVRHGWADDIYIMVKCIMYVTKK